MAAGIVMGSLCHVCYWLAIYLIFNFTNTAPVKLNGTAKSKLRQKQRLWKQYIKTNGTSIYVKFRKVSNQLRYLTRKSVRDLERSISENTKNNPKNFWKYVSQKRKIKSPVASQYRTKDEDKDNLVDSDFDKAETLANQFTSVFTEETLSGIYQNIQVLQMINKLFFLLKLSWKC